MCIYHEVRKSRHGFKNPHIEIHVCSYHVWNVLYLAGVLARVLAQMKHANRIDSTQQKLKQKTNKNTMPDPRNVSNCCGLTKPECNERVIHPFLFEQFANTTVHCTLANATNIMNRVVLAATERTVLLLISELCVNIGSGT